VLWSVRIKTGNDGDAHTLGFPFQQQNDETLYTTLLYEEGKDAIKAVELIAKGLHQRMKMAGESAELETIFVSADVVDFVPDKHSRLKSVSYQVNHMCYTKCEKRTYLH
jgi:uncharacterized protein YegP (UPF0339 family)